MRLIHTRSKLRDTPSNTISTTPGFSADNDEASKRVYAIDRMRNTFKNHGNEASTYRPRNNESREKVPCSVEECGNNGGDVVIGSDTHRHHPVECEVEESEVHEEEVPKELCDSPLESNHRVDDHTIYDALNQNVWKLDRHLRMEEEHCEQTRRRGVSTN
ncbi:hypothetical protein GW17_00041790 [Ensete ventricosum]|nr:hypothetical protein GW17_00041790 [Ensete ventricosum]